MCGIFGFFGKLKKNKAEDIKETIQAIAIESERRGIHSTGFVSSYGKEIHFNKAVLRPKKYVFESVFEKEFEDKKLPSVFIGHNRQASRGKINYKNAHPFDGKRYTLVHNGTSSRVSSLIDRKYNVKCQGDTDSERFLRVLEKVGMQKFIKEILPSAEAFAIVLLDKKMNRIYFLRDELRPLFIVDMRNSLGVRVFASTEEILVGGLELAGWKNYKQIIKKGFNFRPYWMYEGIPTTGEVDKIKQWKPKEKFIRRTTHYSEYNSAEWPDNDYETFDPNQYFDMASTYSSTVTSPARKKVKDLKAEALRYPKRPQKICDKGVNFSTGNTYWWREKDTYLTIGQILDTNSVMVYDNNKTMNQLYTVSDVIKYIRSASWTRVDGSKLNN